MNTVETHAGNDLESKGKEHIRAMIESGWEFNYEPHTFYIGAKHPNGGAQSICEIKHRHNRDEIGFLIAELLNAVAFEPVLEEINGMTLDRAKEITHLCINHSLYAAGINETQPEPLGDVSLQDMLTANKIVADHSPHLNPDGSKTIMCHCADRAIAAIYTANNYPPDPIESNHFETIAVGTTGAHLILVQPNESTKQEEE